MDLIKKSELVQLNADAEEFRIGLAKAAILARGGSVIKVDCTVVTDLANGLFEKRVTRSTGYMKEMDKSSKYRIFGGYILTEIRVRV